MVRLLRRQILPTAHIRISNFVADVVIRYIGESGGSQNF